MKKFLLFFSFSLLGSLLVAQNISLYSENSSLRNNETIQLLNEIAGYPIHYFPEATFDNDLQIITTSDVLFMSNDNHHPLSEEAYYENFSKILSNDGIIFLDYYSDTQLGELFGKLSKTEKQYYHTKIKFDKDALGLDASWLNDALELEIPLSKDGVKTFAVWELDPTEATPIAYYEDGTVAITCKSHGKGKAYFFGMPWRRLTYFPRNNRDLSAQRSYNNGFEPGADIIPLLIRGIIEDHFPVTVWKHTLPKDYKSALVITHEVDKEKSYEKAHCFIDYEKEHHIPAHYFIGTKYINDFASAPLYNDYQGKELLNTLVDAGFTVGSNSVGGFKDFYDNEIFPLGVSSISAESYSPFNDGNITVRGTVLGELMVSKEILEQDGAKTITSYRSGSMRFNKYLPEGLQIAQYKTESSFYANDVMTGFPYFLQKGQSSTEALVDVLEIPVHINDAVDFMNKDEYCKAVDIWEEVIGKYSENYAPVILSIDPDKDYKLAALDMLRHRIEGQTEFLNFEELNTFWRERQNLSYQTDLNSTNKVLTITIPESILPISDNQSLHITKGKSLNSIIVVSDAGMAIDHQLIDWDEESYLLRFAPSIKDFNIEIGKLACSELNATFSFDGEPIVDFDSIQWDFGDGCLMRSSTLNTVKHNFTQSGSYDVSLTIWNNGVYSTIVKTKAIFIPSPPIANFQYLVNDTRHYAPLLVSFYDKSVSDADDSLSSKWSFYDNGKAHVFTNSIMQYEFKIPGLYEINYEVTNANGCMSHYVGYITVKSSLQINEKPYIIGKCNEECAKGLNYRVEEDTLIIYGTVTKNCCAEHTVVVHNFGDTIKMVTFDTYYEGDVCDSVCDYCFEFKILNFSRKTCELQFDDTVMHINNPTQNKSIKEISAQDIWLQPNPTTGMVNVKGLRAYNKIHVEFYSLQGVLLSQSHSISEALEVPIESGVCILKLTVDDKTVVKRVVKK